MKHTHGVDNVVDDALSRIFGEGTARLQELVV